MTYTMTTEETATWDGDDDAARDDMKRELRWRFRNDSRGDVEVETADGITLFVVEADQDI